MGEMADMAIEAGFESMLAGEEDSPEYWADTPTSWATLPIPMVARSAAPRQRPRLFTELPAGPGPCPLCGGPTTLRKGRFGLFLGCCKFPECKGSRNA